MFGIGMIPNIFYEKIHVEALVNQISPQYVLYIEIEWFCTRLISTVSSNNVFYLGPVLTSPYGNGNLQVKKHAFSKYFIQIGSLRYLHDI